jgi:sulfite exporter TauE/SafE
MIEKKAHWIGGTLAAFLGVALVKLLAPALTGIAGSLAVTAGYLLVVVGITIIARATRPKGSEDFAELEKEAKD